MLSRRTNLTTRAWRTSWPMWPGLPPSGDATLNEASDERVHAAGAVVTFAAQQCSHFRPFTKKRELAVSPDRSPLLPAAPRWYGSRLPSPFAGSVLSLRTRASGSRGCLILYSRVAALHRP